MKRVKIALILTAISLWILHIATGQDMNQPDSPRVTASTNVYHCLNHPDFESPQINYLDEFESDGFGDDESGFNDTGV